MEILTPCVSLYSMEHTPEGLDDLFARLKARAERGSDGRRSAVLYVRVSKEDKRNGRGATLEAQEERLRLYAEAMGLEVEAVYRDNGISGGVPFHEREGGLAVRAQFLRGSCSLKKGQKRGAPAHLIAAKLDRLGRETRDILALVPEYQSAGITIHTADEGGKVENLAENENAEFLLTVRAAAAAMEKRKISTRTKAVLAHKRKQGLRTGGIPHGWRLAGDGKHLEECPVEQPAFREIKAAFTEWHAAREEQQAVDALLEEERERLSSEFKNAFLACACAVLGRDMRDVQSLPGWVWDSLSQALEDGPPPAAAHAELWLEEYWVNSYPDDLQAEFQQRPDIQAAIRKAGEAHRAIRDEIRTRITALKKRRRALTARKLASGPSALAARLNSNTALYPKRTGALWVSQDIDAINKRLARTA